MLAVSHPGVSLYFQAVSTGNEANRARAQSAHRRTDRCAPPLTGHDELLDRTRRDRGQRHRHPGTRRHAPAPPPPPSHRPGGASRAALGRACRPRSDSASRPHRPALRGTTTRDTDPRAARRPPRRHRSLREHGHRRSRPPPPHRRAESQPGAAVHHLTRRQLPAPPSQRPACRGLVRGAGRGPKRMGRCRRPDLPTTRRPRRRGDRQRSARCPADDPNPRPNRRPLHPRPHRLDRPRLGSVDTPPRDAASATRPDISSGLDLSL